MVRTNLKHPDAAFLRHRTRFLKCATIGFRVRYLSSNPADKILLQSAPYIRRFPESAGLWAGIHVAHMIQRRFRTLRSPAGN